MSKVSPRIIRRNELAGTVTYGFDTRDANGKRCQKSVTCKPAELQKRYRAWEAEIASRAERANEPWFFESLDRFLEDVHGQKSERSYRHYRTVVESLVKRFFKDMPLADIRRKHVEEFLKWRRSVCLWTDRKHPEQVTSSTLNHTLNVLSVFFNWAIIREYITSNPCFKLRSRENNFREIRLTTEQLNELLDKSAAFDPRLNRLIQIALGTGLRFGEIVNLKWDEVDFERNVICLSRLKTKSRRVRIVPIIEPVRCLIADLAHECGSRDRVIEASYNTLQLAWKRFRPRLSFETANDGPLRLHDLRHCCAQFLLDKGVAMEDIQVILGHQDIATTQRRYAPLARPDLAEKMERLAEVIPFRRVSGEDLVN